MHARAARYLERGFNELKLRVGTREELRALADVLIEQEYVLVMADDLYEHMRCGGPFYTSVRVEPRLRERTPKFNGVSKVYSMTGRRIVYAGGPAWLIRAMQTPQSQSTSNPSTISQAANARGAGRRHGFPDRMDR